MTIIVSIVIIAAAIWMIGLLFTLALCHSAATEDEILEGYYRLRDEEEGR